MDWYTPGPHHAKQVTHLPGFEPSPTPATDSPSTNPTATFVSPVVHSLSLELTPISQSAPPQGGIMDKCHPFSSQYFPSGVNRLPVGFLECAGDQMTILPTDTTPPPSFALPLYCRSPTRSSSQMGDAFTDWMSHRTKMSAQVLTTSHKLEVECTYLCTRRRTRQWSRAYTREVAPSGYRHSRTIVY